ncbi:hypothetical protein F5Y18DRAFT_329812 [Xylariaceae sp. FL1019]|nr:hypothetical protein F5Y18DRAFT_329812 [Xylariaceae sp. FL1019]
MPSPICRGPLARFNLHRAVRQLSSPHNTSKTAKARYSTSFPKTDALEADSHIAPKANAPTLSEAHSHNGNNTSPSPGPKPDAPVPTSAAVPSLPLALPFWQRLGPLTKAGQAYGRAHKVRPWATQFATTVTIWFIADTTAQWIGRGVDDHDAALPSDETPPPKTHDWYRTARSLAIGGSAAIPGYIWFKWLSVSFVYPSKLLSILTQVAVHQFTFTPVFNAYFFGMQALLSGDNPSEAWRRVTDTVPTSWVNSLKLWPAVMAFNFAFIPFAYRGIVSGTVAVGWQTYLSFLNAKAEKMEKVRNREQRLRGLDLGAKVEASG